MAVLLGIKHKNLFSLRFFLIQGSPLWFLKTSIENEKSVFKMKDSRIRIFQNHKLMTNFVKELDQTRNREDCSCLVLIHIVAV